MDHPKHCKYRKEIFNYLKHVFLQNYDNDKHFLFLFQILKMKKFPEPEHVYIKLVLLMPSKWQQLLETFNREMMQ